MKHHYVYASYAFDSGTPTTIWVDSPSLGFGTEFYPDATMTSHPLPAEGYYVLDNYWFEVRVVEATNYMAIGANGTCAVGYYPAGDPGNAYPPPPQIFGYFLQGTYDVPDMYNYCTITGGNGTDRLYQDPITGQAYTNWDNGTNQFSGLFSGVFMTNLNCQARGYVNGYWTDTYS